MRFSENNQADSGRSFSRQRLTDFSIPRVMGILNVTPDSFSDGGSYPTVQSAVDRALKMQEEGAAIIDVGGCSTKPGALEVSVEEELVRVIPVIEKLAIQLKIPISIDTFQVRVAREALAAGAQIVNDVRAAQEPGMLELMVEKKVPICLMHMQNHPAVMQDNPAYEDVLQEVKAFLQSRLDLCLQAGISKECLWVDPGFGYGKTTRHNLQLLARLENFQSLGVPILVGWSRKSSLGHLLGRPALERVSGGLACAVMAVLKGANVIRTHDVWQTCDAIKLVHCVREVSA